MNEAPLLDADLRGSTLLLMASGRLRTENDPEYYRVALKGHQELAEFFRMELN